MLGAIIGDMVGSSYEFKPLKKKNFNIFNLKRRMTDDSLLTLSVGRVLAKHYPINYSKESLESIKADLIKDFVNTVTENKGAGWGGFFYDWSQGSNDFKPYNSYGNGSAMRISPVGWIANSEEEVRILSRTVSEITHSHPEGIKGAECIAMCIYWARTGKSKEKIGDLVAERYYPEIKTFDFKELVKTYTFSEICQKSCPQAVFCFLVSKDLEDAIRNCVAIGGDCDTTGAMAGAIAEAYYQKAELSKFETNFLYFFIDPDIEREIINFYKMLKSTKFQNNNS